MALSDIYMLTDTQKFSQGGEAVNVWFYQRLDPAGTAADLLGAFEEDMIPKMTAFQCNNVAHSDLQCINLGDLEDFAASSPVAVGGISSDMLPKFNALNFTLRGNSRAVRPGSKRIAGLAEDGVADGVVTDGTIIGHINTLASQMTTNIEDTAGLSAYQHVIIKRVEYTTPGGNTAWRLPQTGAELVVVPVTAVLVNLTLTSQVSRK